MLIEENAWHVEACSFALTEEQARAVLNAADDGELMSAIEEIEESWDASNLAACDKAWDAMHRCLTDGQLGDGNGDYPLNHVVLGPRQLHKGEHYIVSFVSPEQVRDVAAALEPITEEWLGERYRTLVPRDYAPGYGEDDLAYTWDWFRGVRELYGNAASQRRAVIFTVDQ
jgi:hypothetical protein